VVQAARRFVSGQAAAPDDAARASRLRLGWRAALLALGFLVLAEASTFLSVPDRTFVSFWLPAGLYVAVLLQARSREWPGLVAAAFAGNLAFDLLHGTPFAAALLFALANAVQATGGAWLVRRLVAARPTLRTLREFLGFLAFAVILSPIAGAAIGAATLVAFGFSSSFAQSLRVWWGSIAISVLLLAPFILTACNATRADFQRFTSPRRLLEAAALIIALLGMTAYFLFRLQGILSPNKGWVVYIVIWAGLRFGALGVGAATLLISLVIAFFTTQLHSGLTPDQIVSGDYLPVMQTSLVALALLGWIPAVVVGERDLRMAELAESERRLKLANQASSIGMWDWDIAGHSVYYSPESKGQLGYRDDELPSRLGEWKSNLHPDDRTAAVAALKSCVKNPGREYDTEFRLRHKDGSYRWIHARGEVLRDAQGRAVRMLGCHVDVSARRHAEEELRRSLARLKDLSRRLVEVEGQERRHISRELHDSVGQNLAALGINLEMIRNQLPDDARRAVDSRLKDTQGLLEATSRHVRDVMAELRPAALDDYGLVAALRTHAAEFSRRYGVAVSVAGRNPAFRLPLAVETELFRITQEALHNVAKHARADRVEVELTEREGRVVLSIADNGTGFEPTAPRANGGGWGLTTMRERAESVDAALHVQSMPGRGTRVVVELELSRT